MSEDSVERTQQREYPPKPVMILVILLAMPLMLPFELYYRAFYPEFRWSKYPAMAQVKAKRRVMARGEYHE